MPKAAETAPAFRVAWLADRSQIAHAQRPGQPRALCGERAIRESEAWPQLRRCRGCELLVAERLGRLPLAENEARALAGDR